MYAVCRWNVGLYRRIAEKLISISSILSSPSLLWTFTQKSQPLAPAATPGLGEKIEKFLEQNDKAPPKRRHYLALSTRHVTSQISGLSTVSPPRRCRVTGLRGLTVRAGGRRYGWQLSILRWDSVGLSDWSAGQISTIIDQWEPDLHWTFNASPAWRKYKREKRNSEVVSAIAETPSVQLLHKLFLTVYLWISSLRLSRIIYDI